MIYCSSSIKEVERKRWFSLVSTPGAGGGGQRQGELVYPGALPVRKAVAASVSQTGTRDRGKCAGSPARVPSESIK